MSRQLDNSVTEQSYESQNMHFLEEIDPSLGNQLLIKRVFPGKAFNNKLYN